MPLPWQSPYYASITSPRSLPGLQLWNDAADTSSLVTDTGIKLWADKSGNSGVNVLVSGNVTGADYAYGAGAASIGTSAFTLVYPFIFPPAKPAATIYLGALTDTLNTTRPASIDIGLTTAGAFDVLIRGTTTGDFNRWTSADVFVAGQSSAFSVVRNAAGNPAFYLNGVDITSGGSFTTGGTPPTWQGTITSTYLMIGNRNSQPFMSPIFGARFYSSALNAASVLADYNGTVQSNNVYNISFAGASKLTSSFVCASGQTVTVVAAAGATGARISGARDLYQGTAANQPTLTIAAAGNYLTFDGSNDYLKAAAFALAQPETIYFVGQQTTWTLTDAIWDGNAINTMQLFQGTSSPKVRPYFGGADAGTNVDVTLATNCILTAVYNGASSLLRLNRATGVAQTGGSNNGQGYTLGAKGDGTAPANITASEVLVYSGAHDTATQDRVIRYLARKWGIKV